MGIIKLDAYLLLISGQDRYTFLDGLSTNKIESSCSTVFTTTSAKIIDVVDVCFRFGSMGFIAVPILVHGRGAYSTDLLLAEYVGFGVTIRGITVVQVSLGVLRKCHYRHRARILVIRLLHVAATTTEMIS